MYPDELLHLFVRWEDETAFIQLFEEGRDYEHQ